MPFVVVLQTKNIYGIILNDKIYFLFYRFDCPKITDVAGDKCYFNKDVLNIGDKLDGEKTSSLCAASCFCDK